MAVTTNLTPTDAWAKVHSATGATTLSCGCKYMDIEVINHNSGSTPPAATLEGYRVAAGQVLAVSLVAGDHLYHRINRTGAAGTGDGGPVAVYTIQT